MRHTQTLRGFTAWLALLAMGLLVFAPTVSRSLEALGQHRQAAAQFHEHAMADMGTAHHQGEPAHTHSHDSFDVCGYCSLLHDSPALLWAVAALLATVPSAAPATPSPLPFPPYLRPLDLCPRGPPLA